MRPLLILAFTLIPGAVIAAPVTYRYHLEVQFTEGAAGPGMAPGDPIELAITLDTPHSSESPLPNKTVYRGGLVELSIAFPASGAEFVFSGGEYGNATVSNDEPDASGRYFRDFIGFAAYEPILSTLIGTEYPYRITVIEISDFAPDTARPSLVTDTSFPINGPPAPFPGSGFGFLLGFTTESSIPGDALVVHTNPAATPCPACSEVFALTGTAAVNLKGAGKAKESAISSLTLSDNLWKAVDGEGRSISGEIVTLDPTGRKVSLLVDDESVGDLLIFAEQWLESLTGHDVTLDEIRPIVPLSFGLTVSKSRTTAKLKANVPIQGSVLGTHRAGSLSLSLKGEANPGGSP